MICNGYDKVLDLATGDLVDLRDVARHDAARDARHAVDHAGARHAATSCCAPGDVWTVERDGLHDGRGAGRRDVRASSGAAGRNASARSRAPRVGGNGSKRSSPWLASAG